MRLRNIVPLFLLVACAHTQALAVTGESIYELGNQFMETKEKFNTALDAGLISKGQYAQFKTFGVKFIQAYPSAATLFHIAVLANDLGMKDNAIQILVALSGDLTKFTLQIAGIIKDNLNDGTGKAGPGSGH